MIKNRHLGIELQPDMSVQILLEGETRLPLARGRVMLILDSVDLLSVPSRDFSVSSPFEIQDELGQATGHEVSADFALPGGGKLRQTLTLAQYAKWPDAFILQWRITNFSSQPVSFERFVSPQLLLDKTWANPSSQAQSLWTFQGAAVYWGQNFAFPLGEKFARENFLGHVDCGEGGGIPLNYFWNREIGISLAYITPTPQAWYMPVSVGQQNQVVTALEDRQIGYILPGQSIESQRTMLSMHQGDFYAPLALYAKILAAQGISPAAPSPEAYQPAWCSWGYEFDLLPEHMTGVLPVLKDLDVHWLTLDDRWFDTYGDWQPRSDTFPGGVDQLSQMVDEIHHAGGLVQIWWYPLAVEDEEQGYDSHMYATADILRQHPDWLILNKDGSVARNNRGLAILDPALPDVQAYILSLTKRFITDWGFDGHKLDNIYSVPPCYNPAHRHRVPNESSDALAEVYCLIFETTRALKPHSVTQICPCGTLPLFTLLPYMDQAVTADPSSSAQLRQRIKFYKAMLGPRFAVSADHVELSDEGIDFASAVGAGGIPSTKFVWPEDTSLLAHLNEWWGLSPEKREIWKVWLQFYRQYHLSDGEYLNLYDLAFDWPETHLIRKGERLYYGFYADRLDHSYQGNVELRGLGSGVYHLVDYVLGRTLGSVQGPRASLKVDFTGYLLVEASPAQ